MYTKVPSEITHSRINIYPILSHPPPPPGQFFLLSQETLERKVKIYNLKLYLYPGNWRNSCLRYVLDGMNGGKYNFAITINQAETGHWEKPNKAIITNNGISRK
jgi:hypothetical protein